MVDEKIDKEQEERMTVPVGITLATDEDMEQREKEIEAVKKMEEDGQG